MDEQEKIEEIGSRHSGTDALKKQESAGTRHRVSPARTPGKSGSSSTAGAPAKDEASTYIPGREAAGSGTGRESTSSAARFEDTWRNLLPQNVAPGSPSAGSGNSALWGANRLADGTPQSPDTATRAVIREDQATDQAQLAREEQAINDLDHYYDIYDNPGKGGNGGQDGVVSLDDLRRVAGGNYNQEEARKYLENAGVPAGEIDTRLASLGTSATHFLEHPDLWNQIDQANDPGEDSNGKISRGDIAAEVHRRQLEQARNGQLPPGQAAANQNDFASYVQMSNAERTPQVIQQEERAILEGIASGSPISFTNANGQTESLTVRQVEGANNRAIYEISGEDGHTVRIESELGASENRTGLARIADYYTQMPAHLRESVDRIDLQRKPDDTAGARFTNEDDRITFYSGLGYLDETVFNHEFAHGIGYELDGQRESILNELSWGLGCGDDHGAPGGWENAVSTDGKALNEYSGKNLREDFAESWSAYMEAREQGDEALKRLAENFPARCRILEGIYNQAMRLGIPDPGPGIQELLRNEIV